MADSGHLISHDLWLITNKHYLESLACLVKKGTNEHPPWPDHLLRDQRPPIDENYHRKHGKLVQFYHIRLCKIINFCTVTTGFFDILLSLHNTRYYHRIRSLHRMTQVACKSFTENSAMLIRSAKFTIGNSIGIHFTVFYVLFLRTA